MGRDELHHLKYLYTGVPEVLIQLSYVYIYIIILIVILPKNILVNNYRDI
jgi:hypothetical protein